MNSRIRNQQIPGTRYDCSKSKLLMQTSRFCPLPEVKGVVITLTFEVCRWVLLSRIVDSCSSSWNRGLHDFPINLHTYTAHQSRLGVCYCYVCEVESPVITRVLALLGSYLFVAIGRRDRSLSLRRVRKEIACSSSVVKQTANKREYQRLPT